MFQLLAVVESEVPRDGCTVRHWLALGPTSMITANRVTDRSHQKGFLKGVSKCVLLCWPVLVPQMTGLAPPDPLQADSIG